MGTQPPPDRAPIVAAKWLGLAYATGLLVFELANADAIDVVVMTPFFWVWQILPAVAAAMLVKASRQRAGAWGFVLLEASLILHTIWLFVDAHLHRHDRAPMIGAIRLAFEGPFHQYVALVLAFLVAWLCGWRARPSWLKD